METVRPVIETKGDIVIESGGGDRREAERNCRKSCGQASAFFCFVFSDQSVCSPGSP